MTKTRTIVIALLAVCAGSVATIGVAAQTSVAARPGAAPTVYSLTLSGIDAHSLDPHIEAMFAGNGGLQLVSDTASDHVFTYKILDLSLPLPVGARVTSLAVTAQACDPTKLTFGSYAPTGSSVQYVNWMHPKNCARNTSTKTGNPLVTVAPGRRYVVDMEPTLLPRYPGDSVSGDVLYGVTVKYTCTSPCVP